MIDRRPERPAADDVGIASEPLSVCLLISSLEFGGAERQVVEMMRTFDRSRVHPILCSLSSQIPLAGGLPNDGQDFHVIEKRGRFDVTAVLRVALLLKRYQVDVVHAFLFDSEIVARLAAPLARVRVVISSERNTDYARPLLHRIALKLTRPLFDIMVANSHAGKEFNIRTQGLDPARVEVVHNGVDTERFYPNREAGLVWRRRFGIPLDLPVIGMVASYKRQKGHDNFLRMAALVRLAVRGVRFVIVGGPVGDPKESRRFQDEVRSLCTSLDLDSCCAFIANQRDMNAVYNACDVTALLSRREGTPNTVLESMACGVPVVASDIADNALVIANGISGFTVPVDDHAAAAERVCGLLASEEGRRRFGVAARARMREGFSLQQASSKLERIYARCLDGRRDRPLH
jgi:glycosyltransferase involved in cell wall biosynthesis